MPHKLILSKVGKAAGRNIGAGSGTATRAARTVSTRRGSFQVGLGRYTAAAAQARAKYSAVGKAVGKHIGAGSGTATAHKALSGGLGKAGNLLSHAINRGTARGGFTLTPTQKAAATKALTRLESLGSDTRIPAKHRGLVGGISKFASGLIRQFVG